MRVIAHALEVGQHGEQSDDQAQVAGHRRLLREQRHAGVVQVEPGAVDLAGVADDRVGQGHVPFDQRLHLTIDLASDHQPHLLQAVFDTLQAAVELLAWHAVGPDAT